MARLIKHLSLLILILLVSHFSFAKDEIIIESRLFKGIKEGGILRPEVVISSFSEPFIVPLHPSKIEAENRSISHLERELNDIYHLKSVAHLASASMIWDGIKENLNETILLEDFTYPIRYSPKILSEDNINLRIEIFKLKGIESYLKETRDQRRVKKKGASVFTFKKGFVVSGEAGEKLFDTEIITNFNEPVLLGFPANGNSYFLSILIHKKKTKGIMGGVVLGWPAEEGIILPPRPVYKITPVYPQECKKQGIEGAVILELALDEEGNVINARVIKPVHPELDKAAVEAIKQWKYEPIVKDGKPISGIFAVAVEFKLRKEIKGKSPESRGKDDPVLNEILSKCAEYCESLANSVLFFVCEEEIKEEIFHYGRWAVSIGTSSFRARRPIRGIERNEYIYDYQLIRKGEDIKESRILLKENGKRKNEKNARLKTKIFHHNYIILGPIGLLSEYWQDFHDYRIVGEERYKGEKAVVIEAVPKFGFDLEHLFGKIWVRKNDFSILKIEWNPQSMENYEEIEKVAKELGLTPQITLAAEYAFEKNKIRFPSEYSVNEVYVDLKNRKTVKSRTKVTYKDYKFFTVETKVKY